LVQVRAQALVEASALDLSILNRVRSKQTASAPRNKDQVVHEPTVTVAVEKEEEKKVIQEQSNANLAMMI
jgi:hypothetical protein